VADLRDALADIKTSDCQYDPSLFGKPVYTLTDFVRADNKKGPRIFTAGAGPPNRYAKGRNERQV
jgi:hypothetical protein